MLNITSINKQVSSHSDNYRQLVNNMSVWCDKCICFGDMKQCPHHFCVAHLDEIPRVEFHGTCDCFKSALNNRVGIIKYLILKYNGIELKNR